MWKLATIAALLVITLFLLQGNRRSFLSSPIPAPQALGEPKCPSGQYLRGTMCYRKTSYGGVMTGLPVRSLTYTTCPPGRTLSGGMCWLP